MKELQKFKKIFLIVLSIIYLSFNSYSQTKFGIKAGLNLTNQKYSGFVVKVQTDPIITFTIGGLADLELSENLGISLGIQLQGVGGKITAPIESESRIDYINIPVKLQYNFTDLFIGAGPYFSYGIGGKNEDNGTNLDLMLGEDSTDHFSPIDYGFVFEAGYKFSKFQASLNYNLGLANINPKEIKDSFQSVDTRNSSIGVSLSYMFFE